MASDPTTLSWGEAAAYAGGAVLALTELMRRTFRTIRGHKAFVEETIKPMQHRIDILETLTEGNQSSTAQLANDIDRVFTRLNYMQEYDIAPMRETLRNVLPMMQRMDRRLLRLAIKAGLSDEDDDSPDLPII